MQRQAISVLLLTFKFIVEPVYSGHCEGSHLLITATWFKLQVAKLFILHTSLKQPPLYYSHGFSAHVWVTIIDRFHGLILSAFFPPLVQMSTLIGKLMEEVAKKGQELVTFKQKHGLKLLDERDSEAAPAIKSEPSETAASGSKGSTAATQGVLVSKWKLMMW